MHQKLKKPRYLLVNINYDCFIATLTRQSSVLQSQAIYDPAIFQMAVDNLINVLAVHVAVPNSVRVHHQHRSLIAAIKTTRGVHAHTALSGDTQFLAALLRVGAHIQGIEILATGRAALALIAAEENMISIIRHDR